MQEAANLRAQLERFALTQSALRPRLGDQVLGALLGLDAVELQAFGHQLADRAVATRRRLLECAVELVG